MSPESKTVIPSPGARGQWTPAAPAAWPHGQAVARVGKNTPTLDRMFAYTLSQQRGEILRAWFPKLTPWGESPAQRAQRRAIETDLFRATDLADLEQRVRRLQQREPACV